MQQHTGQHLLSAIMDTYDNLDTVGWGMGSDGEMNYVDLPRKPSEEEMQAIQDKCNEVIRNNISITVHVPENAKNDSLPDDYDKDNGVVRVISIGNLDHNTYVSLKSMLYCTNMIQIDAAALIFLKPHISP